MPLASDRGHVWDTATVQALDSSSTPHHFWPELLTNHSTRLVASTVKVPFTRPYGTISRVSSTPSLKTTDPTTAPIAKATGLDNLSLESPSLENPDIPEADVNRNLVA